jgi:hypothetical protein
MPRVPLAFRRSAAEPHSSEDMVLLVEITHDDLDAPIYLSTDPTERLSVDPLAYGTISNGKTYQYVEMDAVLPDDRQGEPPKVTLEFENLDSSYVELARSFTSPARAKLLICFASAPDSIMKQFTRLWVTKCTYTESTISFDLARFRTENLPSGRRMTKDRAPGLHGIASA